MRRFAASLESANTRLTSFFSALSFRSFRWFGLKVLSQIARSDAANEKAFRKLFDNQIIESPRGCGFASPGFIGLGLRRQTQASSWCTQRSDQLIISLKF